MNAKAALAATMVRIPKTRTEFRALMEVLARALMGALSSACTSMHVDVSAGSCERDMTCGDATATWDQQMGCRLRCILPLADLGGRSVTGSAPATSQCRALCPPTAAPSHLPAV